MKLKTARRTVYRTIIQMIMKGSKKDIAPSKLKRWNTAIDILIKQGSISDRNRLMQYETIINRYA